MLKHIFATLLVFLVFSGCARNSQESEPFDEAPLQDYGPAPELNNETWLNTDEVLRLENLRGKVVLLEMWTFG